MTESNLRLVGQGREAVRAITPAKLEHITLRIGGMTCYAARRERGTNVQLWSREEGLTLQDETRVRRTAFDRGLLDYDPVATPV